MSMFWQSLPHGFVGLAPMDGVTDPLLRSMYVRVAKPDIMFTEFTCVEGIAHNALKLLQDFEYSEAERPIIAQVFGTDVESFYITAVIVAELGFDGIDINMGCPSKNVAGRGAGAGLIRTPELAGQIIQAVQSGVRDFAQGIISLEDLKMKNKMKEAIFEQQAKHSNMQSGEKNLLPVSVKTRIGYDEEIVENWVSHLLKYNLAALTLHGRTLKQMYAGEASWDAIRRGTTLIKQTQTLAIGNGDIDSLMMAQQRVEMSGVDGVLIGRAACGNPWIFSSKEPTLDEKIVFAIEHCQEFEKHSRPEVFFVMRKHLAWYIKGHPHAKELRVKLMLANSSDEVMSLFQSFPLV